MTQPAASPNPSPVDESREAPIPVPAAQTHAEDLDLEEDVAPNLGGEDQMQDA